MVPNPNKATMMRRRMSGIVPRTNKAEASVTSSTGSRNRNEKLPAGETPREKIDRSTSNGTSGWVEDSLPLPRRRRLEEQEKNNDDNNYNYNYYNRNNDVGDSENENENNNNSNNNSSSYYHNYWENWADQVAEKTEFDSNLIKADDVSVNEVVTAFYYNIIVFILLMAFYEVMRRVAPAVYSSRQKRKNQRIAFGTNNTGTSNTHNNNSGIPPGTTTDACRTGDTENNKSTGGSKSGGTRTEQHTTPPSSTQTQNSEATTTHENNNNKNDTSSMNSSSNAFSVHEDHNHNNNSPLDWLFWNAHSVLFGVSWNHVRHVAGLDGYFFLRFIRMNVRITAVSTVWLCATLIPLYTMGHQVNRDAADQQQAAADAASSSSSSSTTVIYTAGWYHLSAANVDNNSRAMWIPCLALYLFTGFIFFVVSQEYRHYLEIRQDFLAKGTIHVHPQHHYSVLVENIPAALRSDAALAQYFNHLFPHGNTVHSAVMMYKWPNLELASAKCTRSCRRLEKSIAYYHAEQRRPTHVVGRGRVTILGIDLAPLEECTQPCTHALKLDGIMPGDDGDGYFDDSDDDENEIHIIATTKNDNASSSIIQSGASISTLMDAKKSNDKNSSNNYYIELDDDKDKTVSALPFWRQRPKKGTRVDSIAYYTQELAAHSRTLFRMQQRQAAGLLAMEQQQYDTLVGNPANGTSWDYFSPMEPKHPTAVSDAIFSPDPAGAEAIIVESGNDHPNENTATKSGGGSSGSNNLFGCMVERVVQEAHDVVNQIMDDSVLDNALIAPSDAYYFDNDPDDQPKHATLKNRRGQKQVSFPYRPPNEKSKEGVDNTIVAPSRYGSISPPGDRSNRRVDLNDNTNNYYAIDDTATQHLRARIMKHSGGGREHNNVEAANEEDDVPYFDEVSTQSEEFVVPFANNENQNLFRRLLGRLGLDFFVFILRCVTQQVQVSLEGVMSDRSPVSRTGFVTFLDLASTTCAASAPLTVKANVLDVTMAPEPREIIWENVHISKKVMLRRESVANVFLCLGAILWSFPLTAIQLFAKAENLAQIPGMEWITNAHGGSFTKFVNGYLPVVVLLGLISILPIIFEYVAVKYERRKTLSDVQASMLGRYFYYQLANVYVSVSAGSIIKSMTAVLEDPKSILMLLGQSLPFMVGWFVALFVTKILAGLPMVYVRFGALLRMLFLRILSSESKLTQRELDSVYRLENVQYGWEFPTQLLCVVIVYTYAVICPIILPFGFVYFLGALIVYKKQILYVYSPVYESGGAMFPIAVQRSLFGLVCAQMTFWGYLLTRKFVYQPLFVFPLPILTILGMNYLHRTFAIPSERLSLERARQCDRLSSQEEQARSFRLGQTPEKKHASLHFETTPGSLESVNPLLDYDYGVEARRSGFDRSKYRQPVLTEVAAEPWPYRRGVPEDAETATVKRQLRQINRFMMTQTDLTGRRVDSGATTTPPQNLSTSG